MKLSTVQKRLKYLDLSPMKNAGFDLIAFSVMGSEDTFYFGTDEEAQEAYNYFEYGVNSTGEFVGYWYSIEDIEKSKEYYSENFNGRIPEIIYLNT